MSDGRRLLLFYRTWSYYGTKEYKRVVGIASAAAGVFRVVRFDSRSFFAVPTVSCLSTRYVRTYVSEYSKEPVYDNMYV
jgi:hypothetical protein